MIIKARMAAEKPAQLELCRTSSVSRMGVVTSNLTKSSDLPVGCQEPQCLHGHSLQTLETKSLTYLCKFMKTVLSHVARLSLDKREKKSLVDKS